MSDKLKAKLAAGVPVPGPQGPEGPQGPPGPSSTLGVGLVGADGTVYGATGWVCQHALIGKYIVFHNLHLDPVLYTVMATAADDPASGARKPPTPAVIPLVSTQDADSFTVACVQATDLTNQNGAFTFAVLQ